jgi:S-adenosylmethionine/arginine decarboxylase-like enzyme
MIYNGKHYILDGIVKDHNLLNHPQKSLDFINRSVELLDMSLIMAPAAIQFPFVRSELTNAMAKLEEQGLKESTAYQYLLTESIRRRGTEGHTAYGVIAESHIALHTFVGAGFIQLDISSCKDFDEDKIKQLAKSTYGIVTYREFTITRSLKEVQDWHRHGAPSRSYTVTAEDPEELASEDGYELHNVTYVHHYPLSSR